MKKYFFLVAMFLTLGMTSCNENNDEAVVTEAMYADKSFGDAAIEACGNVENALISANAKLGESKLSAEQEAFLRKTLENTVNNVIIPTYTNLANEVEQLEKTLKGLNANTITQEQINTACTHFKEARRYWELSEAFLMGPASDFNVDPTIDSWPLNRSLLLSYFTSGMNKEILEDQSILGFHALEFILFRNGQPRKVSEIKGKDTYKRFENITGAQELSYAQQVCTLLKERCFQLQVAWEGETSANKNRVEVVKAAKLPYVTEKSNISYKENILLAGTSDKSTFPLLTDAITQVLSHGEGSCMAIANEVGSAKVSNPFKGGDISYVESPYSYNSITDFQDNIRSIQNVWMGSTNGAPATYSFHNFFEKVGQKDINSSVENAYNTAISAINKMPAPFVKYVSVVWNKVFEDEEVKK